MVKVGDKVTERLDSISKALTGKVVYVHPEGRYYTAEFQTQYGSSRENFYGPNRRGTE